MVFALTDKQRRFMRRVRLLQEDYGIIWEDATAIAHQLEYLTVTAAQQEPTEKLKEDGSKTG